MRLPPLRADRWLRPALVPPRPVLLRGPLRVERAGVEEALLGEVRERLVVAPPVERVEPPVLARLVAPPLRVDLVVFDEEARPVAARPAVARPVAVRPVPRRVVDEGRERPALPPRLLVVVVVVVSSLFARPLPDEAGVERDFGAEVRPLVEVAFFPAPLDEALLAPPDRFAPLDEEALLRPAPPAFRAPPVCLFTVAQALDLAVSSATPRCS